MRQCIVAVQPKGQLISIIFMYSYYSKVLGSIGIGFVDSLRVNQHVMYGVEQHFKNPCDGFFAELNHRKCMAKQEHMITSIAELVGHFERLGAEARALDPKKDAEDKEWWRIYEVIRSSAGRGHWELHLSFGNSNIPKTQKNL